MALVVHNGEALAYVCNGGEVAHWFPGTVAANGQLGLRSAEGWTLSAARVGARVVGHYASPGG